MTACKFKEGDLVYAPYKPFMETTSSFTEDGYLLSKDSNLKITVVKRRK